MELDVTMTCPIRMEFAIACYQSTARGSRRGPIFEDAQDRLI